MGRTSNVHTKLKIKIRKQMYFIFIPSIVIPVLFIGMFLTTYFANALYQQTVSQLESDNLRVKSILLDNVLNIYNISEDLISDKNLKSILSQENVETSEVLGRINSYNRFETYLENNTSITSIKVYTTNPNFPESKYIKQASTTKLNEWFQLAEVPSISMWLYNLPAKVDKSSLELTFIRSVPIVNSKYKSILVITVSTNYLKNRIQNNTLYTAVSLNQDEIFFCTTRSMQGQKQAVPIDYNKKYYHYKGILDFQKHKELGFISSLPIYQTNETFYITTMDFNAYDSILKIILMCSIITLISIIVPLTGILFYTKMFSSRVVALRKAMSSASTGDYDIVDILRGDDELTDTFLDLKYMIKEIKSKEAEAYETLIKQKELINQQQMMEFKILVSQINPHFIYNTLETIRMLAIESDDLNVSSAIKLLGKAMHYVLEHAETFSTTLDQELDYIDVYLQIQKLRFNERINYSIEIMEGFSPAEYQILPLLMQPIVENAVLHGLKNVMKDGKIKIIIFSDHKSYLFINIIDNGEGIAPEELQNLNSKIIDKSDSSRTSIGLNNISRRIKLFYGDLYSMKIESSLDEGTKVQLVLPLISK